ncbi:hypothetical protein N7519_000287 [Penicillium mononematosum]|uniref:uncharacterized protein n=1 Tax=Penicillium mononematosum TaxID=268346 RepID=UPI0025482480|nr:uncharacterized protein N7519_000287 [Penicillium mononematosum]KAJ6190266.1 hypothetical protein N7519_000287 [Penicillium mononematosum]
MANGTDQNLTLADRVKFIRNMDDQTWPLVILAELDDASRDKLVQRLRPNAQEDKHSSTRG